MSSSTRVRTRLCAAAVTVAAVLGLAPAAEATRTPAAPLCDEPISQPFAPWDDFNWYALAPQGDLEGDLSGWTLGLGAAQVADSEPFGVTGAVGTGALRLEPDAVAESPETCIDPTRETVRLFTRSDVPDSVLAIDAVFLNRNDRAVTQFRVGEVRGSGPGWAPSPILDNPVKQVLQNAEQTGEEPVSVVYRFTARSGSVAIDDFLVDPRWNR